MKFRIYLLLIIASGILFQGCIAKKYVQPEVVNPKTTYRGSDMDSANFATISWESFYQDPHLKALIRTALDSNFDVRVAASNIRAAEEYLKQSKAAFYPTLAASLSVGVQGYDKNGSLGATGIYSLLASTINNGTQASWEIDIWGKIASAKRAQQAQLMQSKNYYQAIKTELVASIAGAYFSLLAYDAQLAIYENSAKTRGESMEVLQALKQSAQSNEIAVNQGSAQYYYAMAQIPQLKIKIQATENLIATLLGKTPSPIERGSLLEDNFNGIDFLKVGIPGQLLTNRPDVRAAEYGLINAFEQWNYARASMYPSLVISGSVGFSASDFANWFAVPGSFVGQLLGGLTAPIFNNRKLKTQRNVAYEMKVQAALNFEKSVVEAQKEIADALTTYQLSNESIVWQKQQVDALNNAVINSLELLKSGYSSYLDLLYAEDNALSASIGLVEVYLQNAKSKIELYRALGGGK